MDDGLLDRLATDLDGSFELLLACHGDFVFDVALRRAGNRADAEEVAQETFIRAYRALGRYPADRTRALRLRGWLVTICLNVERNRHRRWVPRIDDLDATATSLPAPEAGPEDVALDRESGAAVARALASLPDRYRLPLALRHAHGLTYTEVAAALGRPTSTVKSQVHRGAALFRRAYLQENAT